ncbi:Bacterial Fmu (Sun)/eukaryotic nucleolar NOL1/Nop2p [Cynara cardunculus var. scolymus]|uniref:Bacterial Fmu (Sun)/eukaryotic nucleolar NOL1/Nop2p n=1 Tax=Cynara cardunculus var. scolymus TaxID=59895 RepID=A0A118K6C7_CYNCS|nr:Bacterial Fmu (Sun)/eukaryotic nucleolar NOL1/Nop2p [Cynara cardunculus var. scolymus]
MAMLRLPSIQVCCLTEKKHKDSSSKSLKFGESNSRTATYRKGSVHQERKPQKVNLEISPHRAVSAVRLMRIEFGGAFADLLNEKGKGSGDNEMGYVERTLGFCTRDLDDRDLRLILRIGFYEIVKLESPSYAVVDEETNSLPSPELEGDDRAQARALAILYSHPVWMVRRWTKYLGREEAIKLMMANRGKGLVVSIVDPQPGETIIDCCAAPGGKTLFMAACLNGKGMVTAIDINKGRLRILKETAKLQLLDDVITTENNNEAYEKVLLDAPCSGLGVLSKSEDMEELKSLQDELLDAASILVKPGGVLVYSTCSIDPEENEEREYDVDSADRYISPEFLTEQGYYFSSPVKHSLDGAFAARLIRSS